MVILFIGLAKNYKKIEGGQKIKIDYNNKYKKDITRFDFLQPRDAQLISSSIGLDNEVLLRYLYRGKNVLVILDKRTQKTKAIITLKKELVNW